MTVRTVPAGGFLTRGRGGGGWWYGAQQTSRTSCACEVARDAIALHLARVIFEVFCVFVLAKVERRDTRLGNLYDNVRYALALLRYVVGGLARGAVHVWAERPYTGFQPMVSKCLGVAALARDESATSVAPRVFFRRRFTFRTFKPVVNLRRSGRTPDLRELRFVTVCRKRHI